MLFSNLQKHFTVIKSWIGPENQKRWHYPIMSQFKSLLFSLSSDLKIPPSPRHEFMWSHCPVGTSKSGSVDEDVEQLELSHIAGWNVK